MRVLVAEYSFTKDRRVSRFAEAVSRPTPCNRLPCRLPRSKLQVTSYTSYTVPQVRRLEAEGFTVYYEGRDNWEDALQVWPWHSDALVFAARS